MARNAIRVLVADGDSLARRALRDALSGGGLTVVAQAGDAPQAVDLAGRCSPDVVVLDADLPPDGGRAAMQLLAAAAPEIRIVVLTSAGEDGGLLAVADGAAGYLSRDIAPEALVRAVQGVMSDEAAISRTLAWLIMARVRELSAGLVGMRPVRSELTTREWEVVDLLRAGASTAEIADELVLSPDTVHSHVQNVLRKLGAHSRAEAVALAELARSGVPGTS